MQGPGVVHFDRSCDLTRLHDAKKGKIKRGK